ncbi:MAG: TetR/AcrR family transcriptional regulator [Lachnospiraceae bacterium]|jgi:AcrR family transcriptional regulator|nr:TetR/AcrR family transcriptional regulator [Lachnospiraceae bacterium]
MGEKSNQKRQLILETARKIFMEKGYKNVTMKDIVEACGISRGGLYLYFNSTKDIFTEVLRLESQETDDVFSAGIPRDAAASDILALFLKEQKKEILRKKNNLTVATYEYFFENRVAKKDNVLRTRFEEAVSVMEKLILDGVDNGEFYCEDPLGCARNIMYVLEGLRAAAHTMGITEKTVDRELLYIMQGLVAEE